MCDMLADRQHATKQFSLLAETGEWTKFARVCVCVCVSVCCQCSCLRAECVKAKLCTQVPRSTDVAGDTVRSGLFPFMFLWPERHVTSFICHDMCFIMLRCGAAFQSLLLRMAIQLLRSGLQSMLLLWRTTIFESRFHDVIF